MSRTFKGAFGIALGLLAVGLLLLAVAPGLGGALALVALIALGCLVFVVNAMARRSPGWTRVVNPGAAHREAMAEFAARDHAPEPRPTEVDDQEG